MKLTRRSALSLASGLAAASALGLRPAFAADGDTYEMLKLMAPAGGWVDKWEGPEDAPVTIIEYASSTCPHCARFHDEVYPTLKEQYVDTGKARFTLRPFLLNILDAAVFMLAAQTDSDAKYYEVLDAYFSTQTTWATSSNPRDAILQIAEQLGFNEESFNAALTNQSLFEGMDQLRQQGSDDFGITGTPTFYVNGKQLVGEQPMEALAAEIDPLVV
ncbi:MAG: DsbA family protein [Hyphomicrobiaceae bacterium]|nr:DsbA family protein [Hyphomicrobiaceae bacterium]MCC0023051.1 DsbA family protein [Hyphomicrobiaceae bacterium]